MAATELPAVDRGGRTDDDDDVVLEAFAAAAAAAVGRWNALVGKGAVENGLREVEARADEQAYEQQRAVAILADPEGEARRAAGRRRQVGLRPSPGSVTLSGRLTDRRLSCCHPPSRPCTFTLVLAFFISHSLTMSYTLPEVRSASSRLAARSSLFSADTPVPALARQPDSSPFSPLSPSFRTATMPSSPTSPRVRLGKTAPLC